MHRPSCLLDFGYNLQSNDVDEIRHFLKLFLQILESKNCSVKLLQVQSGISSPSDNNFSDYINKLHDSWRAGQNAVVIDEQVGVSESYFCFDISEFYCYLGISVIRLW